MKKWSGKPKKVNKGGPSGLIISLIFHGVAFFIAGIFVVFTVMPKPKPVFEAPPPAERPKMNLKKPKVKIKKSSSPKPSSRIVANVKMAKMPEISIPDLVGSGEGLMGGMGGVGGDGFGMPGGGTISVMGVEHTDGHDLVGTFYDFKRSSSGSKIGFEADYESSSSEKSAARTTLMLLVNKFIRSGCNPTSMARYYRSPKKLYAQCLVIPPTSTSIAPSAFDANPDETGGGYWMVHYKGKLVHKDGIKFRFVCAADYYIVIIVDDEIVWAGVWNTPADDRYANMKDMVGPKYSPRLDTRKYFMGNDRSMAGEWITLEPGEAKDIDIIIGDEDGECGFTIAIEEYGVEYEKGSQGGPLYPIFKTAELSHDMVDQIFKNLPEGEVCVTNGPVFSDI